MDGGFTWEVLQREPWRNDTKYRQLKRFGYIGGEEKGTIARRGPGRGFFVCFVFEIGETRIYLNVGRWNKLGGRIDYREEQKES